ncbi:MAG: ribosome small subunit-dependent GTPase A [Bacteroidales bacterium]|nr:ribosome small subunit-dependent GTPase A [Bacteroidales bacterium]
MQSQGTGTVIKSTGSWFIVQQEDGKIIKCKLKGKFRIKGIKTTNPVAVGDNVIFKCLPDKGMGLIIQILPRNNYIIRKATKLSKISHIIAANIDQAFIIITLAQPRTSTGFIDRFLVTAEAYHIPANIVFNKIDIYDNSLKELHKKLTDIYTKIGYNCYAVSALRGDNIESFGEVIKDKKVLFTGLSGVGKSALINAIEPKLNIKTKDISFYHNKGKHTTTFAEMYKITFGGYIIDTPGIKEFGLINFEKQEVSERFPEMRKLMLNCRFNNCTHVHEPDCAVKDALEKGIISNSRYNNYLSILNDDYWK